MTTTDTDPPTDCQRVRAYHQRTKHAFAAYAPGPLALDWDAQPAPFRHFAGCASVRLPRLSAISPGSALHEALQRPFSALAECIPALPPGLDTLGALLQLALGITAWKSYGPDRWALRANPSSGNLHPTEAYVFVQGMAGLADGIHHYRPEDHALELRAAFATASSTPRLGILLASAMWREAWKYGERAFRYCQLDTGHAAGALRYAAAALGWRLVEQGQVDSTTLARLAGLDRATDFPVRRHAETEREEAEILLWADWGAAPSASELAALADAAAFHGTASMLDAHPLYRWPIIEDVTAATRQAAGDVGSHTLPVASVTTVPNVPVAPLIEHRRSAQRFDPSHVMPLADFAAMLARLQPVAAPPWDVLAAPPRVALAFFVHRVAGLAPGLYLLPRNEAQRADLVARCASRFEPTPVAEIPGLLCLAAVDPVEWRRIARSLHCHQDIAATCCFAVGMLAEFDAALAEGAHGYRQLFRECGLIGQALYLDVEARGLRGTGIGCFFDDPVHELLGLADETWQTLYHFTVGLPLVDTRIETAPGYADNADDPSP
jgi:SagB-type dehydrogenase family enzyme